LKSDGYKAKAVLDGEPKKKKLNRAKLLVVNQSSTVMENAEVSLEQTAQIDQEEEEIPVTPIMVMQNVGLALGIPPKKLTKEQLEAGPSTTEKSKVTNE
jgi:hypothetical protein